MMLAALLLLSGPAGAVRPADLAPGAPELQEAEQRLNTLIGEADAVRAATSRLQARWVLLGYPPTSVDGSAKPGTAPKPPKPPDPCAPERLDVGWRAERFGAAWREAAQAVHAEAVRLAGVREAATVAPLVDERWAARLRDLVEQDRAGERAFLEASVWQAKFVRPVLDACGAATGADPGGGSVDAGAAAPSGGATEVPDDRVDEAAGPPPNGEALRYSWERGHVQAPVAILALGDGWVCPAAIRADDAIVLVDADAEGAGHACWAASSSCGCPAEPVWPGGVLGPPRD